MDILIDTVLKVGRSGVELSPFILLPVMVVMLSLMRLIEARGALDWLVASVTTIPATPTTVAGWLGDKPNQWKKQVEATSDRRSGSTSSRSDSWPWPCTAPASCYQTALIMIKGCSVLLAAPLP